MRNGMKETRLSKILREVQCFIDTNRIDLLRLYVEKLLPVLGDNFWIRRAHILCLKSKKDALDEYGKLVSDFPNEMIGRIDYGMALWSSEHNYSEISAYFKKLIDEKPKFVWSIHAYAQIAKEAGQVDDFIDWWTKFSDRNQITFESLADLKIGAFAHLWICKKIEDIENKYSAKRYTECIDDLNKALILFPENFWLNRLSGKIDPSKPGSVAFWSELQSKFPDEPISCYEFANALADINGDHAAAVDVIKVGLERFQNHPDLLKLCARMFENLGDYEGSVVNWGILQKMGDESADVREGLSRSLYKIWRVDESILDIRDLFSRGQKNEARQKLSNLLQLMPDLPALHTLGTEIN